MEWIQNPNKKHPKCSNIWKETLDDFDLIRNSLSWKIGNGKNFRVGFDPWIGCERQHYLSQNLVSPLREKEFYLYPKLLIQLVPHYGFKVGLGMCN